MIPELGRFTWRRKWQATPVFLPGESHGQKSLRVQTMGSESLSNLRMQATSLPGDVRAVILGGAGKRGVYQRNSPPGNHVTDGLWPQVEKG